MKCDTTKNTATNVTEAYGQGYQAGIDEAVGKAYEDGFRSGHTEGHKDGIKHCSSQMRVFIDKETQYRGLDEAWYEAFFAMKRHLKALDDTIKALQDNK